MNKRNEQCTEKYREQMAEGEDIATIIAQTRADGLPISDAIQVVKDLYGLTKVEVLQLFEKHPVWADEIYVVSFSDVLRAIREKPSYFLWVIWYEFGVYELPMPREMVDEQFQQEIRKKLSVTEDHHDIQRQFVHELAKDTHQVLNALIAILSTREMPLLLPALQVIRTIRFPRNAPALPWIVEAALDEGAEIRNEAISILREMDVEAVVPFFLACFLHEDDEEDDLKNITAQRMCHLIMMKKEWGLVCGPAVHSLLMKKSVESKDKELRENLLSVLEFIHPNCTYAIPTLYFIILRERGNPIGEHAEQLLLSFDERALKPYRYHLEQLLF